MEEGQQATVVAEDTSAAFASKLDTALSALTILEPIVQELIKPSPPPPTLVDGGEPVWVSQRLRVWFDRVVAMPFRQPAVFYELAPMPRCVAVFGREGVDTARALEVLLREHDLQLSMRVAVEPNATRAALDAIECAAKAAWLAAPTTARVNGGEETVDFSQRMADDAWLQNELMRDPTPRYVVVVEHADRLVYTPDNWEALDAACTLRKRVAERFGVMLVFLFDRLMDESDTLARSTPREREMHEQFKAQFDKPTGYQVCPDADYRIALFRWCFEDFAAHSRAVGRPVAVALKDDEYTSLTNFATWVTRDDVRGFCSYVHLELLREPTQVVLDWDFLRALIPELTGTPHIHYLGADELLAIENRFSTGCGAGVHKTRDNRSRLANVEIGGEDDKDDDGKEEDDKDGEKEESDDNNKKKNKCGGEFDVEADTNVTGFACDTAALDKASALLEKQQHPKRRAKRAKKLEALKQEGDAAREDESKKRQREDGDGGEETLVKKQAGDFSYSVRASVE